MEARLLLKYIENLQKRRIENVLLDCGNEKYFKKNIKRNLGDLRKVTLKINNSLLFETDSGTYLLDANTVCEACGLVK